jgi:hypothetical protein
VEQEFVVMHRLGVDQVEIDIFDPPAQAAAIFHFGHPAFLLVIAIY